MGCPVCRNSGACGVVLQPAPPPGNCQVILVVQVCRASRSLRSDGREAPGVVESPPRSAAPAVLSRGQVGASVIGSYRAHFQNYPHE